jgi:hypothetical protein
MSDEFPTIIVTQEAYELSKTEAMGTKYKFWFKHPELGRCLVRIQVVGIDKCDTRK